MSYVSCCLNNMHFLIRTNVCVRYCYKLLTHMKKWRHRDIIYGKASQFVQCMNPGNLKQTLQCTLISYLLVVIISLHGCNSHLTQSSPSLENTASIFPRPTQIPGAKPSLKKKKKCKQYIVKVIISVPTMHSHKRRISLLPCLLYLKLTFYQGLIPSLPSMSQCYNT